MTDHFAEAESCLQKLDTLDAADAYVAVVAAQAHAQLAQLGPAREMVDLQRRLLESMLPAGPTKEEQVKAAVQEAQALARAMPGPEVLRVGLGEEKRDGFCTCYSSTERALDCGVREHRGAARIRRDPMDDSDEPDAFNEGMREMNTAIHQRLRALLADAITGERKNAYEKAIQAVEELAP